MTTIKCSNCGKEIESFKMILHERFCSINVRKCSICEEPVQIDEYPEHKMVSHPDKKCEFCGNIFKYKEYNSHLKTCSKKLYECHYCGLYMNKNELEGHEYQCGSKSMACEYCNEIIPRKEYDLHLEYTCKIRQKFNDNNHIKINNENITMINETSASALAYISQINKKKLNLNYEFNISRIETDSRICFNS